MNFGKVSGNGIGVGLSQRMFEPFCSRSCLVTAQFVLPRVGGEGSRCNSSLLVPGPRGAGNLRFSQLTPGGAISSWEKACLNPLNSILVSGTLGRERTAVGREARRTVHRVCCLQKGCPSVSHSPVLCTGEAAPWGQLQCFCWGIPGIAVRKPLSNNNWPFSFTFFFPVFPFCSHPILFPLCAFPFISVFSLFTSTLEDAAKEFWWLSGLQGSSGLSVCQDSAVVRNQCLPKGASPCWTLSASPSSTHLLSHSLFTHVHVEVSLFRTYKHTPSTT